MPPTRPCRPGRRWKSSWAGSPPWTRWPSQWLENLAVSEALRRLTEREQRILRMRFFEGRTQMEVAGEIGISQAQVSRLEKNALQHMRKYVSES